MTTESDVVQTAAPERDERPVSRGEGRYLCGLFHLMLLEERPIKTGELADYLDVAGATVTETLQAFDRKGLVTYEPYVGAELTDRGERLAREMLWRRCLVEQFFEAMAGVSLTDDQAYRIGMVVQEPQLEQLSEYVTQPCDGSCAATDPDDCTGLRI